MAAALAAALAAYASTMNAAVELPAVAAGAPVASLPPETRGAGRKALIVIEDEAIRTLLVRYLTDHGFKVAHVSNLVAGAQNLSLEFDLLLMDLSLAEGLGIELVRAAKLGWPSIQVLGITDLSTGTVTIDALNAGVDRFIEKPLDLPRLPELLVVRGNAYFLMEEYGGNADALDITQQISSAADRGADLVRQLLAFGRRQVMQPRVLNLNTVISSVHLLLPRLIGEDVMIDMNLQPDLGLVRADPSQLEQVIVHLAAFAKARMPTGGNLRIATSNALAHRDFDPQVVNLPHDVLVRFTMEDWVHRSMRRYARTRSSPSMAPSARARALGLATVYGIVTQSSGVILLDDAAHSGARFQVFLPRAENS